MKTRVFGIAILVGMAILGCNGKMVSPTPMWQGLATPEPMAVVEMFATGTALARTQTAQAGNNPMDMIATLAAGTAIAQTQTAIGNPAAPNVNVTATPDVITHDHGSLIPVLMIILPDDSRQTFAYSLIDQYATRTLDLFDQPRKAVDIRFLLGEAHWERYPLFSVTIEGRTSMTFLVDRLPEDAALYLDQGMLNFVSGEIPVEDWPRDIVLIIVR